MPHVMVKFRFRKSRWQTNGESISCILEQEMLDKDDDGRAWSTPGRYDYYQVDANDKIAGVPIREVGDLLRRF